MYRHEMREVGNNELDWKQGIGTYRIEPEFKVAVASGQPGWFR